MSLRIFKTGLLDTVQDGGRYGFQHLGINPGGAMDRLSAVLANALLGKEEDIPVIEMHFPAAQILFEKETIICITGGDFKPSLNNVPIPLNQPVFVNKNTTLIFQQWKAGARCYLALMHDLLIQKWMGSYSTNLKAKAGGWQGRRLEKGDVIPYTNEIKFPLLGVGAFTTLPWKVNSTLNNKTSLLFTRGREWNWLTEKSKTTFTTANFIISKNSDRMGYRLNGNALELNTTDQLLSSGVQFGTVQLLPNGQLIVLMADHQTTGGYPRLAHVIFTQLHLLAQMLPGKSLSFKEVDMATAEHLWVEQSSYLQQVKNASRIKLENYCHATL